MFGFFPSVAPIGIDVTPDINHYLGFVLKLFFAFGIAFEVPIATILLIKAGITTREKLAKKRQYVVLGAFVLGMLLTPPDLFSQTMLALPMWALFELGLIMSAVIGGPSKKDDEGPDDGGDPVIDKPSAKAGSKDTGSEDVNTEESADEEDVITPAIMPQQENYDANNTDVIDEDGDDDEEDTEEDLDKLAEELDELEDITDWIQAEDKPVKKKKTVKKSVKAKKKKSKKTKKTVKTKKSSKSKKAKKEKD